MAYFPMFIELKNKICLVVGAGQVAARKVKALLEFEGTITVVAPFICDDILKLSDQIYICRQIYDESFLENAAIVIAATDDGQVNQRIYDACIKRNIPVNVVDKTEQCSFFFPAYIKRGPLTIGITSSGKSPLISSKIRQRLEREIPDDIEQLIEEMHEFREELKQGNYTQAERREILETWLQNGGNP